MLPEDVDAVADVVAEALQEALAPVLQRLAVAEASLARLAAGEDALGQLRERVVIVETKAGLPVPASLATPLVDLTPLLERVAAAEARLSTLGDLRDRVVMIETKAALPLPPADLGDVRDRLVAMEARLTPIQEHQAALERRLSDPDPLSSSLARTDIALAALTNDVIALRERAAVLETRPLLPGPAGAPGAPGKDGVDGHGGVAGLSFEGVYQDGQAYEKGHLVTWAGSSWHCNEPTTTKPGDGSKAWTLMVKRGRDGKDGQDAPGALPVVSVGGGRG